MSALTKILIVLQLVFAVALSVLLVLMVSKQESYKAVADSKRADNVALSAQVVQAQTELQNARAQASNWEKAAAGAQADLAKERAANSAKQGNDQNTMLSQQGDIKAKETQIASLVAAQATAAASISAKDKELEALRPLVGKYTVEMGELARKNNEMENQIRANEQAIKKLQEQLVVQAPGAGASINGGNQVKMITTAQPSAAAGSINSKITNVLETSGRTLIEMPLGSRDGIRVNTQLFIYRSSGYVADAVVQRVDADAAVAVITKTKEGQTVQVGDIVSTVGR